MRETRLLIVGGFLGAGKTSAIQAMARLLAGRGIRVGIITNDQSVGLVDTAMLRAEGFPVEEVTGGCFCCRFDALTGALEALSASGRPDVFIAEPVGSCTDLVATVTLPLRRLYGDTLRVSPLSVVVDPIRAERMLGLEPGRNFSARVLYVYAKQLEEAAAIVINKCDLISPERQDRLEAALRRACSRAEVFRISARTGAGMAAWVDRSMMGGPGAESVADVDYGRYAEGEARLGWVNASVVLHADRDVDGNALLRSLAAAIRGTLDGVEIAHLKMILVPEGGNVGRPFRAGALGGAEAPPYGSSATLFKDNGGDIGVINLTRTDTDPEMSHLLQAPLSAGRLLVNFRAEADPDLLWRAVSGAVAKCGCRTAITRVERFRPARPEPTHHMRASPNA